MFYDKSRHQSNISALTQALANSNRGSVNITPFVASSPQPKQQEDTGASIGDITSLATPLIKAGINKFANKDNGSTVISDSINNFVKDTPYNDNSLLGAINSEVTGTSFNNGGIMDTINDNITESIAPMSNSGSGFGYLGLATGLANGLTQGFNTSDDNKLWGGAGNGIQGVFGVDNENQSDVEQGISGTINGASKGAMFGPIGAVVGGLLGLGSSFIDDIGGN